MLKSKKKLLMIAVPVLVLLVAGAGYKLKFAHRGPAAKLKVAGTLMTLDPDFVVNLAGGRYGKVTVAVLLSKPPAVPKGATDSTLPENDVVRSVVTDVLTGVDASQLIDRAERRSLLVRLLRLLRARTDVPVSQVYFTDVAVQ